MIPNFDSAATEFKEIADRLSERNRDPLLLLVRMRDLQAQLGALLVERVRDQAILPGCEPPFWLKHALGYIGRRVFTRLKHTTGRHHGFQPAKNTRELVYTCLANQSTFEGIPDQHTSGQFVSRHVFCEAVIAWPIMKSTREPLEPHRSEWTAISGARRRKDGSQTAGKLVSFHSDWVNCDPKGRWIAQLGRSARIYEHACEFLASNLAIIHSGSSQDASEGSLVSKARHGTGVSTVQPVGPLGSAAVHAVDPLHPDDFMWMVVKSVRYTFKPGRQAGVIRVLFEAWEKSGKLDGSGLHQATIATRLEAAKSEFRVGKVFQGHVARGTILRSQGKGVWALHLNAPLNPL